LTRNFQNSWTGPYKITKNNSDLNNEKIDQNNKKHFVHVNRLKKANISGLWKPKLQQNLVKKTHKSATKHLDEKEEN